MASQMNTHHVSRSASWIGGIALALIAVLAGVGYVGMLTPLIVGGDPAATAQNIAGSELQFRLGVLFMIVAAVLDVAVAAALFTVLEPVNRMVAATAAWFRVAYSAVFVVAIGQLAIVPGLLDEPNVAMNALESYTVIWRVGLILFAAHLLLVGYLGFRSGFMPRVLGILIGIAGVGYLIDGVTTVLVGTDAATISSVTFIGEVALIAWLLVTAIRRPTSA